MQSINIHLLVLAALVARLVVVFVHDRVYHPDEIFQYLEQAHRLTFGYGYIPWEYRYGTRSWILPGFISGLLFVCRIFGVDDPAVYTTVVKVVFCILSVSLIYSVYIFAREIGGEASGKLAAIFTCFWYELVYFAHKPLPELLSTYLIMAALAGAVIPPNKSSAVLVGLFSGMAVVLRPHYLPVIAVLAFFVSIQWRKVEILTAASIFFFVALGAGYIDYLTWGSFFASFYNTYLFNAVYGVSELFGTERFYYFFKRLTVASAGLFAIAGIVGCFKLNKTWLLLAVLASIIIPHSLIPHKEYRFVLATIPVFLALLAIIIADYRSIEKSKIADASIMIVLFLSLAGLFGKLPFQPWVINHDSRAKEEILQAYLFLYKEPGLTAIWNASAPWFATGGYYYLHRDVPIYSTRDLELKDDLRAYVSHIVCPTNQKDIPGFTPLLRMKALEIRGQTNPPPHYVILDRDTKNVRQPGVDDRFTITVERRL
jgi:hypothetical protein